MVLIGFRVENRMIGIMVVVVVVVAHFEIIKDRIITTVVAAAATEKIKVHHIVMVKILNEEYLN